MLPGPGGLLSVDEVANGIGRHPEVVRRQARAGRLPAEKIGRGWFFRPARLVEAGYPQFLAAIGPLDPGTMPPTSPGEALLLAEALQAEEALAQTLATATETRDTGHARSAELARLADLLALDLGLDPERRRRVRHAALLHDLGKLGLPDAILNKPGPLDPEERAVLMTHPVLGAELLERAGPLASLAPLIRAHHEWFNGEGYPQGLKGQAIPLESRIVSVVHAFVTMTCDRPYRAARSPDDALAELRSGRGTQFDPAIVDAFAGMLERGQQLGEPGPSIPTDGR